MRSKQCQKGLLVLLNRLSLKKLRKRAIFRRFSLALAVHVPYYDNRRVRKECFGGL
jgi:hypothetical protein